MAYSLRRGVSLCEVAGRLLFLDIDADRYFALAGDAERALLGLLHEVPLSEADRRHLRQLAERGVLDIIEGHEHLVAATSAPPAPDASLIEEDQLGGSPAETIVAAVRLAASIVRVKRQSLRSNLAGAIGRRGAVNAPDRPTLRRVAGAFDRAGRIISAHDRCLPQSLAVMRTIAANGGWAQVVLGVTLGPFAAHCWVQHGSLIINDRVDRVRCYTPILVV